jgi:hypothetical protein
MEPLNGTWGVFEKERMRMDRTRLMGAFLAGTLTCFTHAQPVPAEKPITST